MQAVHSYVKSWAPAHTTPAGAVGQLGLLTPWSMDKHLIEQLLEAMNATRADFTTTFRCVCVAARLWPQGLEPQGNPPVCVSIVPCCLATGC